MLLCLFLFFSSGLIYSTEAKNIKKSDVRAPKYVKIESTGRARDVQPDTLGVYVLTEERIEDAPVYKKLFGPAMLIFKDQYGYWNVHEKSYTRRSHLTSPKISDYPPRRPWHYSSEYGEWKSDDKTLEVIASESIGGDEEVKEYTDYCDISREHTICKYPGISPYCEEKLGFVGLTERGIENVLTTLNLLRTRIAQGETEGQPAASNMKKLRWNKELAKIAQRWADQCILHPDDGDVRKTLKGEFINQLGHLSLEDLPKGGIMSEISKSPYAWYLQHDSFDPKTIENITNYQVSSSWDYIQLGWADTTDVGCGLVHFHDKLGKELFHKTQLWCNFLPFEGTVMYKRGEACADCTGECEDSLCV